MGSDLQWLWIIVGLGHWCCVDCLAVVAVAVVVVGCQKWLGYYYSYQIHHHHYPSSLFAKTIKLTWIVGVGGKMMHGLHDAHLGRIVPHWDQSSAR